MIRRSFFQTLSAALLPQPVLAVTKTLQAGCEPPARTLHSPAPIRDPEWLQEWREIPKLEVFAKDLPYHEWNLFRPCPAGDRKNRIVLVQFKSRGDLENGGRFTVKKYQSVKRVTEEGWSHEHIELLPLNRDYDPIIVTPHEAPEMVVVGEWVASID